MPFSAWLSVTGRKTVCRGAFQCVGYLALLGIEQSFLGVRAHVVEGGSAVLRKERREVDFFSVSIG